FLRHQPDSQMQLKNALDDIKDQKLPSGANVGQRAEIISHEQMANQAYVDKRLDENVLLITDSIASDNAHMTGSILFVPTNRQNEQDLSSFLLNSIIKHDEQVAPVLDQTLQQNYLATAPSLSF